MLRTFAKNVNIMRAILIILIALISTQFSSAQVVVNELDCDTPGTDTLEFIELKTPSPNTSLDGYVLVLFNGSSSGMDSSYYAKDLDGTTTDENGLLVLGSTTLIPFPQVIIPSNLIQQGADAVAIYQANDTDFPDGTLATTTNLIDALVYETDDPEDATLQALLGETFQIDEDLNGNKTIESIQLNNDGTTYAVTTPTPRQLNDGTGVIFNPITISTLETQYGEGETFDITFTANNNVTEDTTFSFTLNNFGFTTGDFTGNTTVTILNGQNSVTTSIILIDDAFNEGDDEMLIKFSNLPSPNIANNNFIKIRAVDNDFIVESYGTPVNPTYGLVSSTQPNGYYDPIDGLSGAGLRDALQGIIADPAIVRAQTYSDVISILKDADVNPENSNQVWLVYTEQSRAKLDIQTTGSNFGKWNREHTFPRSRGGFNDIEGDEIADGIDNFWATKADSLRHANSDAHALRAADGPENSARSNQHYGQYNGPAGTLGSFKGDVARSVLFLDVRYNGLDIVNGFTTTTGNGELGDLDTLLDWHRNDPPDDYEMNRNNVVYTWQFNRNPFIDQPDLVEYIWGNNVGDTWNNSLSTESFQKEKVVLYPNPVKDELFVSGISGAYKLSILSSEGRQLQTETFENNEAIKLNLSSGLYLVRIETKEKVLIRKILIK
jgi:hypothetical protein